MNLSTLFKITLFMGTLFYLPNLSSAQHSKLPPGLVQFKDSMLTDISLDLKNATKGILRYRKNGEEKFHRVPLGQVQTVQIYPQADGALRQTFVVRSRQVGEEYQLVLVKQLLAGDYNLLVELNNDTPFYWEDPDGKIINIPSSRADRKTLINKILQKNDLKHHNKTAYFYRPTPLRQVTAYLNGGEQQKYPGSYFKGKLEYLSKRWNFTKLSSNVGFSIIFLTEQLATLKTIQGQSSNIIALSVLFEAPFYNNNDLTFIQEIGVRKELTYIKAENASRIIDFKMDASFLTGGLAIKYSDRIGKHFPFVRLGLGGSVLLSESNRFLSLFKNTPEARITNDEIVSAITLHPGLRAGTEFYLGGPYLLTLGLTYTREMMLFRTISSSSNAFGVYTAISFY